MSKEPKCPFIRKSCAKHGCTHYMHISGVHPQTGAPIEAWDCSMNALVMMQMEHARAMLGMGAEISVLRSENGNLTRVFGEFSDLMRAALEGAGRAPDHRPREIENGRAGHG